MSFNKAFINVQLSFNNTIITLTKLEGEVLSWVSGGSIGFIGPKRSTAIAAMIAAKHIGSIALVNKLDVIEVRFRGLGKGREGVLNGLRKAGVTLSSLTDITGIPHNGCRPPKSRRL